MTTKHLKYSSEPISIKGTVTRSRPMEGCPDIVEKEFSSIFKTSPEVIVSAPGRLDFLNTHQDYKGLPVVAVGINLRTYVAVKQSGDNQLIVGSGNLLDENSEYLDKFWTSNLLLVDKPKWFGNYIRSAVKVLSDEGYSIKGARIWIRSEVPMGSGLGSSGTLLVAVIGALNEVFGLGLSIKDIAEYAYKAEHDVMGIPCGRLDQYAAAFGNIIYIETRPPYNVEVLSMPRGFFAVLDTGIKHSTADIHPARQSEIDYGLSKLVDLVPERLRNLLGKRYWEPKWELLDLEILDPYLRLVEEKPQKRILYTLKAHRSTLLALKAIRGDQLSVEELAKVLEVDLERARKILELKTLGVVGEIMTYQHKLLSELYEVSLPQIDYLVNKLLELGALGAKLSGAGLGGAVIALFGSRFEAEKAIEHVISLGYATKGWAVSIDDGFKVCL